MGRPGKGLHGKGPSGHAWFKGPAATCPKDIREQWRPRQGAERGRRRRSLAICVTSTLCRRGNRGSEQGHAVNQPRLADPSLLTAHGSRVKPVLSLITSQIFGEGGSEG